MTAQRPLQPRLRRIAAQRGFTLIEVVVAIAIMGLGLALLYQILGANTQAVGITSQYQRAAMLAQSLLNAHDAVPESGWNAQGQSGGYDWQVRSQPYETPVARQHPGTVPLHELRIQVYWQENGHPRTIALATLRPQRFIQGSANDPANGAGND